MDRSTLPRAIRTLYCALSDLAPDALAGIEPAVMALCRHAELLDAENERLQTELERVLEIGRRREQHLARREAHVRTAMRALDRLARFNPRREARLEDAGVYVGRGTLPPDGIDALLRRR